MESGLRENDILVRVDGKEVADLAGIKALYAAIVAENRAKKRVFLEVLREGLPRYIALEYEKEYDTPKAKAGK
jgi:S1-C subfamily serine protease